MKWAYKIKFSDGHAAQDTEALLMLLSGKGHAVTREMNPNASDNQSVISDKEHSHAEHISISSIAMEQIISCATQQFSDRYVAIIEVFVMAV